MSETVEVIQRKTGDVLQFIERKKTYVISPEHRWIGYSYKTHAKCEHCGIWIRLEDLPEFTDKKSSKEILFHKRCGYRIRQHARSNGKKRRTSLTYID